MHTHLQIMMHTHLQKMRHTHLQMAKHIHPCEWWSTHTRKWRGTYTCKMPKIHLVMHPSSAWSINALAAGIILTIMKTSSCTFCSLWGDRQHCSVENSGNLTTCPPSDSPHLAAWPQWRTRFRYCLITCTHSCSDNREVIEWPPVHLLTRSHQAASPQWWTRFRCYRWLVHTHTDKREETEWSHLSFRLTLSGSMATMRTRFRCRLMTCTHSHNDNREEIEWPVLHLTHLIGHHPHNKGQGSDAIRWLVHSHTVKKERRLSDHTCLSDSPYWASWPLWGQGSDAAWWLVHTHTMTRERRLSDDTCPSDSPYWAASPQWGTRFRCCLMTCTHSHNDENEETEWSHLSFWLTLSGSRATMGTRFRCYWWLVHTHTVTKERRLTTCPPSDSPYQTAWPLWGQGSDAASKGSL